MELTKNSIIFVNGTSSAGKTTLCRELKNLLEIPFWHFSSDHFIDAEMHPKARFESGEFDWPQNRPLFFDAFHRAIAAFSEAGLNLLVEHILEEAEWAVQIAELLEGSDVFVVAAKCPTDELIRREKARGDRNIGEAEYHLKTYLYAPADIVVDTSQPVALCCDQILNAWRLRKQENSLASRWKTS